MSAYIWEGKRVRLRTVEPSDWETFAAWNLDTDGQRRCDQVHFPRSTAAARRWAEEEANRAPDGDQFRFAIETLDSILVGSVNTFACDPRNGTFKLGLGIGREHQRRGYASDAIRLVLRYMFGELRYQKATVHIYSFNEPSIRLFQSLGFVLEGRLRRMYYTEGRHHDEVIYGQTAEEFAAR